MKFLQRIADRLSDELANHPFVMEFHFPFGRMNIHIDVGRIDFKKKATEGVTAFHQGRVVPFEQREIQSPIFHRAPVDKEMLILPRRARDAGLTDVAPNPNGRTWTTGRIGDGRVFGLLRIRGARRFRSDIDGEQFRFVPKERAHSFPDGPQRACGRALDALGRQLPNRSTVFDQRKGHRRVRQRCQHQVVLNVGILGFFAAQKFAPGRQIEKELAHFEASAGGRSGLLHLKDFAPVNDHLAAGRSVAGPFARGQ
jgi:hypothetical protein